eukprot:TRINITY_DN5589_c0_g4_i2.p11 TRINITY_DN5589_c0_g4~~TRINITY_DN5589_c0_g4_i2.p11  ORF type:complete len:108 (-),score=2.30 TRINITY_DN5589_c0_g4_i2:2107-2430(-)
MLMAWERRTPQNGKSKRYRQRSVYIQVKKIMADNVQSVMDRGEKLYGLEEKTEDLLDQAKLFKTKGAKLRMRMFCQNMKMKIVLGVLILLIIFIIVIAICSSSGNCF